MNDLEAALNMLSQQGWHIILYPEMLPVFKNSFVMVARRPGLTHLDINLTLTESARQAILVAMALSGNNLSAAAKRLGISRNALYRKMKKYKIQLLEPERPGDRSLATLTTNLR